MARISVAVRHPLRVVTAVLVAALGFGAPASSAQFAPPSNDAFDSAQELVGAFGALVGSNDGATKENGEPDHDGVIGNASVWFRWTAPQSGKVVFDTLDFSDEATFLTTFDTILAVYTGTQVDALTRVASNDDLNAFVPMSRLTFTATAGTTYRIAVDGVAGKKGSFRLHFAMPPENDDFSAPQRLVGLQGVSVPVDNSLATREPGEPRRMARSVWYRWQAPQSGPVVFTTRGSEYDTVLWVFRGRDVTRLRLLTRNDDAIGLLSRVRFTARSGRVYRIAVTSFDPASTGRTSLTWWTPSPPGRP